MSNCLDCKHIYPRKKAYYKPDYNPSRMCYYAFKHLLRRRIPISLEHAKSITMKNLNEFGACPFYRRKRDWWPLNVWWGEPLPKIFEYIFSGLRKKK